MNGGGQTYSRIGGGQMPYNAGMLPAYSFRPAMTRQQSWQGYLPQNPGAFGQTTNPSPAGVNSAVPSSFYEGAGDLNAMNSQFNVPTWKVVNAMHQLGYGSTGNTGSAWQQIQSNPDQLAKMNQMLRPAAPSSGNFSIGQASQMAGAVPPPVFNIAKPPPPAPQLPPSSTPLAPQDLQNLLARNHQMYEKFGRGYRQQYTQANQMLAGGERPSWL